MRWLLRPRATPCSTTGHEELLCCLARDVNDYVADSRGGLLTELSEQAVDSLRGDLGLRSVLGDLLDALAEFGPVRFVLCLLDEQFDGGLLLPLCPGKGASAFVAEGRRAVIVEPNNARRMVVTANCRLALRAVRDRCFAALLTEWLTKLRITCRHLCGDMTV